MRTIAKNNHSTQTSDFEGSDSDQYAFCRDCALEAARTQGFSEDKRNE
jgi:hypothetical protein